MSRTAVVSEYSAGLRRQDVPDDVIAAATRVTLDLLGAALAAHAYPAGQVLADYAGRSSSSGLATVIGTVVSTVPAEAALLNGALAADMELDDVHLETAIHPSSVFVPALLAAGEAHHVRGDRFLTGLVVAYDVGCSLAAALGVEALYARGVHPTAVAGAIGAAAGVGHLLGLDPRRMEAALGLAGTQAAGLLTWELEPGHFTKSLQSGVPARAGVTAAELAGAGYQAASGVLDGRYGLFETFTDESRAERLTAGLGTQFEVARTGYKFHSSCRYTHSAIDALLTLREQHDLTLDAVTGVTIAMAPQLLDIIDGNALLTHNMQYLAAMALRDGEITRTQTDPGLPRDSEVARVQALVTLSGTPELASLYPERWPTTVVVETASGDRHTCALENPLGDDPDRREVAHALTEKYRRLASTQLDPEVVDAVHATVADLADLADIADLAALLRVPALGHRTPDIPVIAERN